MMQIRGMHWLEDRLSKSSLRVVGGSTARICAEAISGPETWAGRHDLLQDAEASGNMSLNVQPNAVRKVYLVFHGHEFRFMREIKESSIKGHMRNPLLVSIIHVQEQKAGYVSSIIIKYRYIRVVIHPPH